MPKITRFIMDSLAVNLLLSFTSLIHGHGLLLEPPPRNYMWKWGYDNPPNYDYAGLNCGGFATQWGANGGRCGVCGDPYQGPLRHESGYPGGFANGIIASYYREGYTIDVSSRIAVNHKGFISFKICPANNNSIKLTQECFDRYPLYNVSGEEKFFLRDYIGNKVGVIKVLLVLPRDLRCKQCVFQWKYTTGHTSEEEITPQETFVNCADISISGLNPAHNFGKNLLSLRRIDAGVTTYDHEGLIGGRYDCDLVEPHNLSSDRQNLYYWCLNNCLAPEIRNCSSAICRCYRIDS